MAALTKLYAQKVGSHGNVNEIGVGNLKHQLKCECRKAFRIYKTETYENGIGLPFKLCMEHKHKASHRPIINTHSNTHWYWMMEVCSTMVHQWLF